MHFPSFLPGWLAQAGLTEPFTTTDPPTPNPIIPSNQTNTHRDFVLEAASATPGAEPGEETARMDALASAYVTSAMRVTDPLPVDNRHRALASVTGRAASPWALFRLNLWRCGLQLGRDRATLGLWAAVSALIGALLGILYWQQVRAYLRGWVGGGVARERPISI